MIYRGRKTSVISFPLGGIGAGSVGLAGNGALIDWEIFNKPNKGSFHGFTHFAVKAEAAGKVLDARALVADLPPPYTGGQGGQFQGFGFGPSRYTLQGMPHFKSADFIGEFPIATVRFKDKSFPGQVTETAFNPFIPLNDRDSSIPAAFFQFEIKNTTNKKITYTVAGLLKNRRSVKNRHDLITSGSEKILHLTSDELAPDHVDYGDMALATDAEDFFSVQQYAYRGLLHWFETLGVYWQDLSRPGRFVNRVLPPSDNENNDEHGLLAAHFELKPGQTKRARFLIAWHYPNMTNYWNPEPCGCGDKCPPKTWKNYYATLFTNSADVARYAMDRFDRLYNETLKFKKALFASTVPSHALDAVSANISILKSPTVLRLTDGSLYGFEGCHCNCGCCEGTCTHVWNYAYAACFLFPNLERSMRELEYRYTMREDGKLGFRLQLPVGRDRQEWHACADGQFGGVLKCYREWKISGNDEWLKGLWPAIKQSLEFAWAPSNEDRWDLDKDGVLEGRQHHTLDTELFGPNAWLTGYYLAALKAAAEIADQFGESDKAREYRGLFEQGKKWSDKNLFNGEYYRQKIDLRDQSILEPYRQYEKKYNDSIMGFYWSDEHGQIKRQIGNGCHCDQVMAQWHANLIGLGEVFDPAKVKKALQSIYRYNFKKTMRNFANPCRLYALHDEAALIICDWPKGDKPACPLSYAEEAMNGFEYQAAIHMIQEGLVKEGLEAVKAIRDRYDGERRNPWNEFECGSNYARSMASFALLPALAGFQFDMVKGHLGFAPVGNPKNFTCFWSIDGAWGLYERKGRTITLRPLAGRIQLKSFSDSLLAKVKKIAAPTQYQKENDTLIFHEPVTIDPGRPLVLKI